MFRKEMKNFGFFVALILVTSWNLNMTYIRSTRLSIQGREPRILCWIMTYPNNHGTQAKGVKDTWGKRCNILLFMSTKTDPDLPAIGLTGFEEDRDHLWAKTLGAFNYILKHYRNDADWFLKADDDTYVIMENLRFMLEPYKPSDPIYFGCKYKPYVKQGYMSGGSGYVLSQAALHRLEEAFTAKPEKGCKTDDHHGVNEDVEIGKCLESVGVVAGDSRDAQGRGRFMPFRPEDHVIPGPIDPEFWYWKNIWYPSTQGPDCCSNTLVSFHYITHSQMHVMDFLLYRVRPHGMNPMKDTVENFVHPVIDPVEAETSVLESNKTSEK